MSADPLLAISELATRCESAGEALPQILNLIGDAFGADSGAISLFNPDISKLETEARFGLPADEDLAIPLGQGIPGWAAFHARPALAGDVAADHRYRAIRPGVRCQMASPLLAPDGQPIGVISLDRDRVHAYGRDELERLTALTEEASRVLNRLWQLEHLQDQARHLETLLTTGQALVAKLEPQALFDTLTDDAREMMRARAAGLYLFDEAAGTVRIASLAGVELLPAKSRDLPIGACLVASAIHTRKAVAFADVQSPEFRDLLDLPRDATLRSVLATPLVYEGEVLGVLAIFLDRLRIFDNEQKRVCAALASLAAVALQNARLYGRVFRSEESLRKSERLTTLGLLAAEIAHEIRNPLTVLKLLQGGLGLEFPEGDPRRTDLRVISEKLDQLEAIVTRVLSFGQAPSSLHTRVSLTEIVDDTLLLIRLKLAQSKVHARFGRPTEALVVDAHKGQIQQVLLNLLLNAMQAMPDGGTIELAAARSSKGSVPTLILDVIDTGPGIPETIRPRIFDSFLSGRPGGTGLGLAIAKRVMLSHHGDIALVSTGPTGTTFRLTLPLAKS